MKAQYASIKASCLVAVFLFALFDAALAQFTFTINKGAITITGYTGSGGAVVIPDTINGYPATTIGYEAFYTNRNVTSVTMGTNITSIQVAAFEYCTNLTSVTIPNNVTSIEDDAFYECTNLTSVMIGDGVTSIMDFAFYLCTSLTNITVGNSVTNIGNHVFGGCVSLTKFIIPHNVTSIGGGAFADCQKLTSLTIPKSVTNIGGEAFDYCYSLKSVYFQGNAPTNVDSGLFYDDYYNLTVYYLPGTTNWENFAQLTGVTTVLWNPQVQTGDASFGVQTKERQSSQFGFNITGSSNLVIVVEACTNLASVMSLTLLYND